MPLNEAIWTACLLAVFFYFRSEIRTVKKVEGPCPQSDKWRGHCPPPQFHHLWSSACTWIEPMVVINSQPWGIGHWFVFKRVCVHCLGMKGTYFSDSFLITFNIYQLIPKLTNHINKKVNILMAPLITKIKQNLHQKIQEKRVCSAAYLSVNTFVFKQQSFHSEVMERSYFISGDNKIITLGKKSLFMHCYKF